jgi:hypothetical protein
MGRGVAPQPDPARGDHVGGEHLVRHEAERPAEHADAAEHRVADDSRVARGADRRGKPVRADGGHQIVAAHPGPDPDPAPVRVDGDLAQRAGAQHDGVLQRVAGTVPAALRGHPQPVAGGEGDRRGHVIGTRWHHDRGRPLVDAAVPRPPGGVPVRVGGHDHAAAQMAGQLARPRCGAVYGHLVPSVRTSVSACRSTITPTAGPPVPHG